MPTLSLPPAALTTLRTWIASPRKFVTEALGVATIEPWQAAVLQDIEDGHTRIAIKSGHGVGKSALLAWIALWFICTRFPCKIGCTAPTSHQLEDILWPEIALWYARLSDAIKVELKVGDLSLEHTKRPDEAFARGRTARPEQPEAIAGLHSPNTMILCDEASGIDDRIFEAGIGSLSTPNALMILTGNPTRLQGMFHDAFTRPGFCEQWRKHTVSSEDVPRARHHIADIAARYGKESNAYRVRVQGHFPTTEDDSVISLAACDNAVARMGKIERIEHIAPVWGLDVARFGDDRTALAKRQANYLLEPVKSWRGKDTMQTAYMVEQEYRDALEKDRPARIYVDVIGVGAGVVDRMRELGLPVVGINVGEAASANDRYNRFRDELWFRGRDWLTNGILCDDRSLIAELTQPKYSFSATGKIIVERKEDLKERGLPSPDLADAFLLTFAGGDHRREVAPKRRAYQRTRPGSELSPMAA